MKIKYLIIWLATLVCFAGLSPAAEPVCIKLATTTSTENSGLLNDLLPQFKAKTGIQVDVIAVGSGKALKLGENGDVDVILAHAPAAEAAFVKAGYGVDRRPVMFNDFVLVGPASDPAGIKGRTSITDAMTAIAKKPAPFVSRGDDSGTHQKENELWQKAAITPRGVWYLEAGQGMEATLRMAQEKGAYTLTDRGTYLSINDKLQLVIFLEGDPTLFNRYGIMAVNPKKHPHVKYNEAIKLVEWMTSDEGRQAIAKFKVRGKQLFFPVNQP